MNERGSSQLVGGAHLSLICLHSQKTPNTPRTFPIHSLVSHGINHSYKFPRSHKLPRNLNGHSSKSVPILPPFSHSSSLSIHFLPHPCPALSPSFLHLISSSAFVAIPYFRTTFDTLHTGIVVSGHGGIQWSRPEVTGSTGFKERKQDRERQSTKTSQHVNQIILSQSRLNCKQSLPGAESLSHRSREFVV